MLALTAGRKLEELRRRIREKDNLLSRVLKDTEAEAWKVYLYDVNL